MYLLTLGRFTDNLIHIDTHAYIYIICNKNSAVYEKEKEDRLSLCAYTRMSSTVRWSRVLSVASLQPVASTQSHASLDLLLSSYIHFSVLIFSKYLTKERLGLLSKGIM